MFYFLAEKLFSKLSSKFLSQNDQHNHSGASLDFRTESTSARTRKNKHFTYCVRLGPRAVDVRPSAHSVRMVVGGLDVHLVAQRLHGYIRAECLQGMQYFWQRENWVSYILFTVSAPLQIHFKQQKCALIKQLHIFYTWTPTQIRTNK